MLGERRSKAAFSAGFAERVQEQPHENSGHLPAEIWKEEDPDFEEIMEDGNETEENRQRDFFGGEDGAVEKTEEPEEEESEPSHVQRREGGPYAPMICSLQRRIQAGILLRCCGRYRPIFPKSTAVW